MLNVKLNFVRSIGNQATFVLISPTTIVLYNRMYMCKVFPSIAKSAKKENAIYTKYFLHCLRHIDVWQTM